MQGDDKIIIMDMNTFDKVGRDYGWKGPHNLDITPDGNTFLLQMQDKVM